MTPIDYKALAERIERYLRTAEEDRCEADAIDLDADLRTVVSLLEGIADEKPALWMQSNHVSWAGKQPFMARCAPTQLQPDFVPLHLHPAPQPQPDLHCAHERFGVAGNAFDSGKVARPHRQYGTDTMSEMGIAPMCDEPQPERQPLTNEQIDEIGEPFGYFTYGDAQGDKRRAFVRAIESSHGIGYGKAIEGGPSELRSCTCHPDDNPPAPCAQQYALNECRAAQPERQPTSEPTRWKVGNELAPYHPDASHVEPGYRDGWNACYRAMRGSEPTEAQIEAATDAWQAHCGLLLLSREGARDEVLIVLRAALAAKETK